MRRNPGETKSPGFLVSVGSKPQSYAPLMLLRLTGSRLNDVARRIWPRGRTYLGTLSAQEPPMSGPNQVLRLLLAAAGASPFVCVWDDIAPCMIPGPSRL